MYRSEAVYWCTGWVIRDGADVNDEHRFMVRRLAIVGFLLLFLLSRWPCCVSSGTDFRQGAVRWFIRWVLRPSRPIRIPQPGLLVVVAAWMMAAFRLEINGPPGKDVSFALCISICVDAGANSPTLGRRVGAVRLGRDVILWQVPLCAARVGIGRPRSYWRALLAYSNSERTTLARRIDAPSWSPDIDPRTQLGYATEFAIREGVCFGVGVGEGQVKMVPLPMRIRIFINSGLRSEDTGCPRGCALKSGFMPLIVCAVAAAASLVRERDPFVPSGGQPVCV